VAHQVSFVGKALRVLGALLRVVLGVLAAIVFVVAVFELTEPDPAPRAARTDDWYLRHETKLSIELPGLTLQYFDGDRLWANRYDEVWRSDDVDGERWTRVGSIGPAGAGLVHWARHAARASRTSAVLGREPGIAGLLVLRSGVILAARPPHLFRSGDGGASWESVLRLADSEPRRGLFRDWGVDGRGRVWVAERGGAAGRGRLLRSDDDGATFAEAWALPADVPGRIRLLRIDPLRGRPWVAVGGGGAERQLGWVDEIDQYQRVGGGEPWYEVSDLVFTGAEVFLVNALPHGPAGVWRYSRARGTVEQIGELAGPAVNATLLLNETLVVSTAAAGLGAQDVQLWFRDVGGEVRQLAQIPRYRRAGRADWGTLLFAAGEPLPDLRFTAERVGRIQRSVVVGARR